MGKNFAAGNTIFFHCAFTKIDYDYSEAFTSCSRSVHISVHVLLTKFVLFCSRKWKAGFVSES